MARSRTRRASAPGASPASATRSGPFASLYALIDDRRVAAACASAAVTPGVHDHEFVDVAVSYLLMAVRSEWLARRPHLAHLAHDRSELYARAQAEARRAVSAFLAARPPRAANAD